MDIGSVQRNNKPRHDRGPLRRSPRTVVICNEQEHRPADSMQVGLRVIHAAHGEAELRHPEPGYCAVGMKSYGRAATLLMTTGYRQVRGVDAYLDGDTDAATQVKLELLPEAVWGRLPLFREAP